MPASATKTPALSEAAGAAADASDHSDEAPPDAHAALLTFSHALDRRLRPALRSALAQRDSVFDALLELEQSEAAVSFLQARAASSEHSISSSRSSSSNGTSSNAGDSSVGTSGGGGKSGEDASNGKDDGDSVPVAANKDSISTPPTSPKQKQTPASTARRSASAKTPSLLSSPVSSCSSPFPASPTPEGVPIPHTGKFPQPVLETRVDIGQQFYMSAQVFRFEPVLIDVGLGVIVEMTLADATRFFRTRRTFLEGRAAALSQRIDQVTRDVDEMSANLDRLNLETAVADLVQQPPQVQ